MDASDIIGNITELDKIIAATQARNAAKGGGRGRKLTDEQREERRAKAEQQKAERKAAREARKAERNAEPRVTKLDKLRAALPELTDNAAAVCSSCERLTADELSDLVQHLQFKLRSDATSSSRGVQHTEGASVRVVTGKHAGSLATVTKSGRVRCHVQLTDGDKHLYCFNSDIEAV